MISVRRAEIKDIPMIMQFLDEHWLKGYALAHNRKLFDWQFVRDGQVNIWIGIDDLEHKMYAMEGAILYNTSLNPDFSTCLWIALKCDTPMLGLRLSEKLLKNLPHRESFAVGLNEKSAGIQRRLHKKVPKMDHYYRLNDLDKYSIAKVTNKTIPQVEDTGYTLTEMLDPCSIEYYVTPKMLLEYSPYKDYKYIEWRYFDHPMFKYNMWGIKDDEGLPCGILVTRTETANGAKSAKIVDFYGNNSTFGKIGFSINKILIDNCYEYIDIYSYGLCISMLEKAGFVECTLDSDNIITNFFQPYLCQNSDIYIIEPRIKNARLFRGDADQDKPRYLPV